MLFKNMGLMGPLMTNESNARDFWSRERVVADRKKKPSEMEVALPYRLFTLLILLTLFTLLTLFIDCSN